MFGSLHKDAEVYLMPIKMPPTDWGGASVDRGSTPPEDITQQLLFELRDIQTIIACIRVAKETLMRDAKSVDQELKNSAQKMLSSVKSLHEKTLNMKRILSDGD